MSDNEERIRKADEDLQAIRALKASAGFAYLAHRLNKKRDAQADLVLNADLPPEKLAIEQRVYKALKEVADIIDTDERLCIQILKANPNPRGIPF